MSITFAPAAGTGPQLNVSNGNAAQLLELLGLPRECEGTEPAEGFLGRVLLAQALLSTATVDDLGFPEVRQGNWIDCGRRPGYLAEKLSQLHQVATWALRHRQPVGWW